MPQLQKKEQPERFSKLTTSLCLKGFAIAHQAILKNAGQAVTISLNKEIGNRQESRILSCLMNNNCEENSRDQIDISELIPLSEAAELSEFSQGHLSHLMRNGEIWGAKIGRNWVTTAKAVREYLARDRRPGPK